MIDISKCPKETPIEVYNPDGSLLVKTDSPLMLAYIRLEVMKNNLEGYYMLREGETEKCFIDSKYGNLSTPGPQCDTEFCNITYEIVKLRINRGVKCT